MEMEMKRKVMHKTRVICKACGKIEDRNSSRQLYCKECGRKNAKQYIADYIKKYRTTDVGKNSIKISLFKQRTKINGKYINETFTMKEWFEKLDDTKGICPMCKKFIGKDKLTMDHIYPISKAEKGRTYTINDIQPLCRVCNTIKGNTIERQ